MTQPSKPLVELAVQSRDATNAAFDALLPEVAKVASQMSTPQQALGVVQALLRLATSIAHSTIGTPLDVRVRTDDEAAALAAAHWRANAHINAIVIDELKRQGAKVPPSMVRVHNAAPPTGDGAASAEAASAPQPAEIARSIAGVVNAETPTEGADEIASTLNRINSRGGSS